jgi:hypothetical protein
VVAKIIHYSKLVRQHHLNFLEHKRREYREREDYLVRLRKLFFNIEAQMRQAELQQLEVFRQLADHFKVPLEFPNLGDRVGLQQLFASHPFLFTLQEFFEARQTKEECCQKIMDLLEKLPKPSKE